MWNNVLHGFSFLQSKQLPQLFVLILRISSVITLQFDMIKKKTISEAIERPKGVRLNKGNSEGNRISRKILLCYFWRIGHFTVVCGSETDGDLVLIQTFLLYYVNQVILMLTIIFQEQFP